ncbi:DUF4179 domain-containing protein [Rummeliibacillus pycnus]|uniref:DUF4179 domain-containing protein n=1 Tax=Rummeliibacillus pycnus TaxID=101070 RepID=UPI0037C8C33A
MKDFNDQQMKKLIQELDQIDVPRDALHVARKKGAQQFRLVKRKKRNYFTAASVVFVLTLLFITCIRVSPTFAQAIEKIPGFAPIVEMIGYDKGVKDIVSEDYFETLNITKTKNNITLTLLGTVADESGMILFYQVEAPYDISKLTTKEVKVLQNGKPIKASMEYGWQDGPKTKIIKNKIEIVSKDSLSYEHPNFELHISFEDAKQTTFSIPFTLKKKIQSTKTYNLNKNVTVDGQIIHLKTLKISPLRAEIQLASDKNNTQQILRINSIKLIDENDEIWGNKMNGITGFGSFSDGNASLFIQSNYFRRPKKLTLIMDKIEALPKGEEYIVVDFKKKEIIQKPNLVNYLDYTLYPPDTIAVNYQTKNTSAINEFFSHAVDRNNKTFTIGRSTSSSNEDYIKTTYTFDTNKMKNPVQIYF